MGDLRAADRVRAGGGDRAAHGRRARARWVGGDGSTVGLRDLPTPAALAGDGAGAAASPSTSPAARALALVRAAREVARGRMDLHGAEHERGWRRLRAIPGIGAGRSRCSRCTVRAATTSCPPVTWVCSSWSGGSLAAVIPRARAEEHEVRRVLRRLRRVGRPGGRAHAWRSHQRLERARDAIPSPGRNSLVNGGRPAVSGSC